MVAILGRFNPVKMFPKVKLSTFLRMMMHNLVRNSVCMYVCMYIHTELHILVHPITVASY